MSPNEIIFQTVLINVNSLVGLAKRHEFQDFLKQQKPHAILLTETKLKPRHKIKFDNYTLLRNDRLSDGGGGTAICIKNDLEYSHIPTPDTIKSFECTIVKISQQNQKNITLISVYKPPTSQINTNELETLLSKYENTTIISGGDFNAHNKLWGATNDCNEGKKLANWYLDNFDQIGIKICPTAEPTCFRSDNGSYLDFFFVSEKANIKCESNDKLKTLNYCSDHAAVLLEIETEKTKRAEKRKIFNLTAARWNEFNKYVDKKVEEMKIIKFKNASQHNIDDYIQRLNKIFEEATKKYVPTVEIDKTNLIKLSTQSNALIKQKKSLRRLLQRNKHHPNANALKTEIKCLTTMICNSVTNDYKNYWNTKISGLNVDNNIFKNIKKISNYKSKYEMPTTMYEDENKTNVYNTQNEICEALSTQFENAHKITNNFGDENTNKTVEEACQIFDNNDPIVNFSIEFPANPHEGNTQNELKNHFIDLKCLIEIVKSRNTKKSAGADHISNYMIKKVSKKTLSSILLIFNHCINISYFPNAWKHGIVTPIAKHGKDNQLITSYRPITMISSISKCFEKFIDTKIRNHCESNKIFDEYQFGFRKKYGTNHALCRFTTDVAHGLNNRQPTIAIPLDYEKAFDVIWHKGLLYKMYILFKFDFQICKLIKNYLSNRTFSVKLGNQCSTKRIVTAGAPQGSILAAPFFIIYTSDYPKHENTNIVIKRILYADDVLIYVTTILLMAAQMQLNEYINNIILYSNKWKLKLSKQKCELISIVGKCKELSRKDRKNALDIKVKMGNHMLPNQKQVKYLGILYTRNFEFNRHIDKTLNCIKKAKHALGNIFYRKNIKKPIKLLAYKQLIRPIITYGTPNWLTQISSHQMERIRKEERVFLRACTGLYRKKDSYKYVNAGKLYADSNVMRIDRQLIKYGNNFIKNCKNSENETIKSCTEFSEEYMDNPNNKRKIPACFESLSSRDSLLTNNKLLYFNKKKANPNEIVYITNQ